MHVFYRKRSIPWTSCIKNWDQRKKFCQPLRVLRNSWRLNSARATMRVIMTAEHRLVAQSVPQNSVLLIQVLCVTEIIPVSNYFNMPIQYFIKSFIITVIKRYWIYLLNNYVLCIRTHRFEIILLKICKNGAQAKRGSWLWWRVHDYRSIPDYINNSMHF